MLWNFAFQSPLGDLTDPDNLRCLHTVTGLKDEEWFYLISVALESRGGPIVKELLKCMDAADVACCDEPPPKPKTIFAVCLLLRVECW